MKKIIFTLIAILLQLTMVNAAKLNFRTNTLMFYEYSVNGTVKYFKMYTSNTTNRLMYTESPLIEPSYETDYLLLENALDTFDESIQNKIKSYIRETELEQVFATQMLYYKYSNANMENISSRTRCSNRKRIYSFKRNK